jgi:hypothetical protein
MPAPVQPDPGDADVLLEAFAGPNIVVTAARRPDATHLDVQHRYAIHMAVMLSYAATPITDRAELVRGLREKYGERKSAVVFLMPNAIAELFTNPRNGTWTIIRTNPHRKSCMAAAGKYPPRPESAGT